MRHKNHLGDKEEVYDIDIFHISIDSCTAWNAILSLRFNQDAVPLTCGFCSP